MASTTNQSAAWIRHFLILDLYIELLKRLALDKIWNGVIIHQIGPMVLQPASKMSRETHSS